jgi:hypothetical protein
MNMPVSTDDFTIYRGERKIWTITLTDITGNRVDLTSATGLYFTVRNAVPGTAITADTDAGVLFALSANYGINVLNPPASGQFEIVVDKGQTTAVSAAPALNSPTKYLYGLEYVPTGETSPRVLAEGNFWVYPDIVKAV